MAYDTPPAQIQVTDNTAAPSAGAAFRYLLTAAGSFAVGKGWITGDVAQALTLVATVAAPTIWGVVKAYTNKKNLIRTADAAPNSVAKVI